MFRIFLCILALFGISFTTATLTAQEIESITLSVDTNNTDPFKFYEICRVGQGELYETSWEINSSINLLLTNWEKGRTCEVWFATTGYISVESDSLRTVVTQVEGLSYQTLSESKYVEPHTYASTFDFSDDFGGQAWVLVRVGADLETPLTDQSTLDGIDWP